MEQQLRLLTENSSSGSGALQSKVYRRSVLKCSHSWAVVFVLNGCSNLLRRHLFLLRILCYLLCDVRKC